MDGGTIEFNPERALRFHYQVIDDHSRKLYRAIYDAVLAMRPSVDIPNADVLPDTDLLSIYQYVKLDNPLLFWMGNSLEFRADGECNTLVFSHLYSKRESERLRDEVMDASNRIRDKVLRYADDEYGIELAIHDLFAVNIGYGDMDAPESHSIIGPLLRKKGVCEGISMAVEYLLNCFGIRCTVITGDTKDGSDVGHAWNIVFLGDHGYHLDVTWDLCSRAGWAGHSFFNVSDDFMRNSRDWDCRIPCQGSEFNYFRRNGTEFDSMSKVKRYVKDNIGKGKLEFRIKGCYDLEKVSSIVGKYCKGSVCNVRNSFGSDVYFVSL